MHDHQTFGQGHHRSHDVFDEQHRLALLMHRAQQFDHRCSLGRDEPGENLVEEHDAWLHGQGASEFESLQACRRHGRDLAADLVGQLHAVEDIEGMLPGVFA